jgi:gluconate 2-dehydrogenase gamma chain
VTTQSEWPVIQPPQSSREQPLFFTPAEWDAIEAATARIIPTDHDPGAREAQVVRFLDQFLSGIDYIYAAADGRGFIRPCGIAATSWQARIEHRQRVYREGVRELETLARQRGESRFVDLDERAQDDVLELLSGLPRPGPFEPSQRDDSKVQQRGPAGGAPPPTNQPITDEGLGFFGMLVLHTRQGFYADPAYGGNAGHVGWATIGFPGPRSLAETRDGTFTTTDYMSEESN